MASNIKDVAERAGVSIATVSNVINGSRNVSDEKRHLVLKAIQELDYVPNKVARTLRRHQSNSIALIVPDISNFFFTEVAKTVEQALRQNDYVLIFCNSCEDPDIEERQIAALKSQMVSGYILAPVRRSFNYRTLLPDPQYPLVLIDRKTDFLQADTVLCDDTSAIGEAISDMIDRGHRRIAYIAGLPGLSTTYDRLNAYYTALNEKGLQIDAGLVREGDSSLQSGYRCMEELLDDTDATAVFVSNSSMTNGAMHCLKDRGVRIPQQMAIVGYDDNNWASITNPPLSTVRPSVHEIGETAARLVLERIGKVTRPYDMKSYQASLIRRDSY